MIAKFNLYDFIANLLPGLLFLWCLQWMCEPMGLRLPLDFAGGLAETSILVAVGYVAGLMLQAVSERFVQQRILLPRWGGFPSARWLLPEDRTLSKAYKDRVLALIKERFGVDTEAVLPESCSQEDERTLRLAKNRELFFLCYDYVDNLSPRPLSFVAQFGLFRCLLTVFGLLSILAIAISVFQFARYSTLLPGMPLLAGFYALLCWLCYARCRRRSDDFARTVYNLFVAGVASKSSA